MKRLVSTIAAAASLAAFSVTGLAQEYAPEPQPPPPQYQQEEPPPPARPPVFFIEAGGNWGVQIGNAAYVPNGTVGSSKYPWVTGFGFQGALGFALAHNLWFFGDYTWAHGKSRSGEIDNVLTKVNGWVTTQEITAGIRMTRRAGPGMIYGQLGVGVVLPFTVTQQNFEYAPQLAAIGITGTGQLKNDFGWGVGGHGEFGYQLDFGSNVYLATGVRLAVFQSNNDGEKTHLRNFVVDFNDPVPVTADINHGTTRATTPETYSVQDARFHANLGIRF